MTGSQQNKLVSSFLTTQLGFAVIPGGTQRFHFHYLKQANNDNIEAYATIQLADLTGTPIGPTISSGIAAVGWIDASTPDEVTTDITLPTTGIDPTNRMIVKLYLNNNNSSAHSTTWYTEGNSYYSFVITSVGVVGNQGDQGPQGDIGSQGFQGDQGPQGDIGPAGATGMALDLELYQEGYFGIRLLATSSTIHTEWLGTNSQTLMWLLNDGNFYNRYSTKNSYIYNNNDFTAFYLTQSGFEVISGIFGTSGILSYNNNIKSSNVVVNTNGVNISTENLSTNDRNLLSITELDIALTNTNDATGDITGIYMTNSSSGINFNFPNSSARFNNIITGDEYFRIDELGAILSTYSTSSSERAVVLDSNDRLSLTTNPITISLNFNYGTFSYTYISPYDIKINSFTTSTTMSVSFNYNGTGTYALGSTISQFSNLSITVSSSGLLVLQGNKLI